MEVILNSDANKINYDPNPLLDAIRSRLKIRSDASLSRVLGVAPPVISKIRHRKLPIGASLLIRMHDATELSIKDLRELMGDFRNKFSSYDLLFSEV
jgi:hypothetical protein